MDAIRLTNLVKKYGPRGDLSLAVRGPRFSVQRIGKEHHHRCMTECGSDRRRRAAASASHAGSARRISDAGGGLFEPPRPRIPAFVARMFADEATTRRVTEPEALSSPDTSKTLAEYSTVRACACRGSDPRREILFLTSVRTTTKGGADEAVGAGLPTRGARSSSPPLLDTVERLCHEVSIVIKPGKLVWQGDITALNNDGAIECDGQEFRALEPLFLHLTGQRSADLKWL